MRNVSVELSVDGGTSFILWQGELKGLKGSRICRIQPSIGPANGGTLVEIRGSGFSGHDSASCLFGTKQGTETLAHILSDQIVQCTSPAMQSGDVSANEGLPVEVQLKLWSGATATTAGGSLAVFAYQGASHVTDVYLRLATLRSSALLDKVHSGKCFWCSPKKTGVPAKYMP